MLSDYMARRWTSGSDSDWRSCALMGACAMTKPRQKPPTIRIGGQVRAMTGNAIDGYRLRIDKYFTVRVRCLRLGPGTVYDIRCMDNPVEYVILKGTHEQQAANRISAWFESRARSWLGGGK
jgi:hypothetical protein